MKGVDFGQLRYYCHKNSPLKVRLLNCIFFLCTMKPTSFLRLFRRKMSHTQPYLVAKRRMFAQLMSIDCTCFNRDVRIRSCYVDFSSEKRCTAPRRLYHVKEPENKWDQNPQILYYRAHKKRTVRDYVGRIFSSALLKKVCTWNAESFLKPDFFEWSALRVSRLISVFKAYRSISCNWARRCSIVSRAQICNRNFSNHSATYVLKLF